MYQYKRVSENNKNRKQLGYQNKHKNVTTIDYVIDWQE